MGRARCGGRAGHRTARVGRWAAESCGDAEDAHRRERPGSGQMLRAPVADSKAEPKGEDTGEEFRFEEASQPRAASQDRAG